MCVRRFWKPSGPEGGKPSTCLRPSLNFEVNQPKPNNVLMEASSTVALVGLGDEAWADTGRWALTQTEEQELLRRIDRSKDGVLEPRELKQFSVNHAARQWVMESLPSTAQGLLCESLIDIAFEHFDHNNDGSLDEKEWGRFLRYLSQLRLRYLHEFALAKGRKYYGRGQKEDNAEIWDLQAASEHHIERLAKPVWERSKQELESGKESLGKSFQYGVLVDDWPGWRADVYYDSCNNHPLHGIIACDRNNRLERLDRFFVEVATCCFCFWMAHERRFMNEGEYTPEFLKHERVFSILCVTIPGYIIYYILIYLFTTPHCGMVDESSADEEQVTRARRFSDLGDATGMLLVVFLIGMCFGRLVIFNGGEPLTGEIALIVLKSRFLSYALSWGLIFGLYFNPFIAWGSSKPKTTSLGDWIGLGQWAMEKQKLQLTCMNLPMMSRNLEILHDSEIELLANATQDRQMQITKANGRSCESCTSILSSVCGIKGRERPKADREERQSLLRIHRTETRSETFHVDVVKGA